MPEEAVAELIALARAAHAWAHWWQKAKSEWETSDTEQADELVRRTNSAVAQLTRLARDHEWPVAETLAGPFSAQDVVVLCAACKAVRVSAERWQTLERYLRFEHGRWVSHSLCEECAFEVRSALPTGGGT